MSAGSDREDFSAVAGPRIHSHFRIVVGGVSFAYCYIRKNACSAWKRLFIQQSPVPFRPSDGMNEIEFMSAHMRLRTIEAVNRCDHRVVVVRDPVDRYVSAFVNLLVTRTPPGTVRLRKLSRSALGRDVLDVSFDQLLASQLPRRRAAGRESLDKHFWPQVWHLAPTRYTDVLDIEHLAVDMRRLIGDELGSRYFGRAVNATSNAGTYDDPEAPSLLVRDLIERFRTSGQLPGKASFIGGGRGDEIRAAYDEDSSLFEACRVHYRDHPGVSMEFEMTREAGRHKQRRRKRPARNS
jgi:hypothetical protein